MSDQMLDAEICKRVLTYLGNELAGHTLATSEPLSDIVLTPPQTEVAKALVHLFSGSQLEAWNALRRWDAIASVLCEYDSQFGRSLAAHMHYLSGGVQPNLESDDDLEKLLCQWAVDVYPLFLIGGMGGGAQHHISSRLFRHPLRSSALEAMFRAEEPLMALFPQADFEASNPAELYDLSSYVRWSDGSGGTVDFSGILESILLRSTGALQQGEASLAAYIDSVRDTLAAARCLAEGKKTRVAATVGCYSMSFADNLLEIRLAGGRFRRKTPMDHALMNESQAETVVLEIGMDLQLVEGPITDQSAWFRPNASAEPNELGDQFWQLMQDRINRARMAVLLASSNDEVLTVGQSFVSLPLPVTLNGGYNKSPLAWPVAPFQTRSRTLTVNDVEPIGAWDALLEEFPGVLRIGSQRLLAAVNERVDPYDGFIDAVITWENLFGTTPETTFKVCAAIAWLLEPVDEGQRAKLFSEARTLYSARSHLVHGSVLPPKKEITRIKAQIYRDKAVDIAMAALRAVLRSDELRQAPTSTARGEMLLLGSGMSGSRGNPNPGDAPI